MIVYDHAVTENDHHTVTENDHTVKENKFKWFMYLEETNR
jgi:hypothetical protein